MAEVCSGELPRAQRAAALAGGSGAHVTFNIHIPWSFLCPPSEVIVSGFEPCGGGTEALRVARDKISKMPRACLGQGAAAYVSVQQPVSLY